MAKNKRNLSNLVLNPKYQVKYVFWITFTGLILTLFNGAVFYNFVSENYKILVDLAPMTDEVKAQLYKELYQILILLGGFAFVFLGLVCLLGFVISHRTAGPMYRFKKAFQEVKDGNLDQRIHLRPNDDFQDVAESFNQMMDILQKKN